MVGSNDIERSRHFYDALFGKPAHEDDKGRLAYRRGGSVFMVSKPLDGEPASHGNGGTIGFNFECTQDVDAWHKAGVENGGTSIEDPPGYREISYGRLYLAYLRDPDGNKLCALHRPPQSP
jgi:catechol 2,3-dioxygenase-like lactoylglutathione lyase family enzyme